MRLSELEERRARLRKETQNALCNMETIINENNRVIEVAHNARFTLDELHSTFIQKTKLEEIDVALLFVAIGLQIIRQYLLTKFPHRLDDQTAAKNTFGHGEEHSNRVHRYYKPSLDEIITNPVPFDANIGANGALSGGGKMGHRVTAIGHDPLLGLIFGTANIATATLTTATFESYHIYTNDNKRDYFKNHARTELVLSHTVDKMINQGIEGKTIVATSLVKEIIHLKSDINTKYSLPLPGVSAIDPKFASELAEYGFDMANVINVGKQASYAMLINSMIAMIHRMFYDSDDEMDKKLFEVRTRKILSYSNIVASSTNLAVVAVTKDMKMLDLGGLAVSVYRLITDKKFIREVKEEFIFGSFKKAIEGDKLVLL